VYEYIITHLAATERK